MRVLIGFALLGLAALAGALLTTGAGAQQRSLTLEERTPSSLTVTWSWDAPPAAAFELAWRARGDDDETAWRTIRKAATDRRHTITELDAGLHYVVRLRGLNAANRPIHDLRGIFATAWSAPRLLRLIASRDGALTVGWSQPSDWNPHGWRLSWRVAGSQRPGGTIDLTAAARSRRIDGLSRGTDYLIRLSALNARGGESPAQTIRATASAATLETPALTSLSWSGLTIRAEWQAVPRADGYDLFWRAAEERGGAVGRLTVEATSAEFNVPAGAYWVELRARRGAGRAARRSDRTQPRNIILLPAPHYLRVQSFDGEHVRLAWPGADVPEYDLEWGRGGTRQTETRDGRSGLIEVGPLEGGNTYEFRVRARNDLGQSGWSPTAALSPTIWPQRRPLAALDTDGSLYVLWPPAAGAEWYEAQWVNAADPAETARVRVSATPTEGGGLAARIPRDGGFEDGRWLVRVRAGPWGTWSIPQALDLAGQPPRLSLALESSRELCTAGTLTEISWQISGGSAPYALSMENSAVDVSADNVRINCGALTEAEATDAEAALAARTITAVVTDSRGVQRKAALDVTRVRALPAPELTDITAGGHRTIGNAYWNEPTKASTDLVPAHYLVRWRTAGSDVWTYDESVREPPRSRWMWSVDELREGTSYELSIAAMRDLAEQLTPEALRWSGEVPFRTVAPPQNVVATSTHSTITVTWSSQPGNLTYAPFVTGPHGSKDPSRESASGGIHRAVFVGLQPDTEYEILIPVLMTEGQEVGASTTIRTKAAPTGWIPLPTGPQDLRVTLTHDSITATWDAPHEQAGPYYLAELRDPETSSPMSHSIVVEQTSVEFNGLRAATRYEVTITHLGIAQQSTSRVVSTTAEPSDEVRGQRATSVETPFPFPSSIRSFAWPVAQGLGIRMTSDPWIWRGTKQAGRFHAGLDVGAPTGTPVYAIADGMLRIANAELEQQHVLYCPDSNPRAERPPLYQQIEMVGASISYRIQGERLLCNYIVSPLSGRTVLIFHGQDGNGPEISKYSHLSAFAKGLETRIAASTNETVPVAEGELIGYIGGSALSDEEHYPAHLHFEIRHLYGTVSVRWYGQHQSAVSCSPWPMRDPDEVVDTKGDTHYRAYCGWHAGRRMTSVLDPEAYFPPLLPTATSLTGERAIELSDLAVVEVANTPTVRVTFSASVARPQFYSYHDFEWVPAEDGGIARTQRSGLARSRPNVTGYRIRTSRGCELQPTGIEFLSGYNVLENDVDRVTASLDVPAGQACTIVVAGRNSFHHSGFPSVSERDAVPRYPTHVTPHSAQLKVYRWAGSRGAGGAELKNFDLHFYVFHASLGTAMRFTTLLGTVADVVLELRDATGKQLKVADTERGADELTWTATANGWYVLIVRGGYVGSQTPSSGTYWLTHTLTSAQLCNADAGPVGATAIPGGSSSVVCVPRKPGGLTVSNVTDTSATLSWTASTWPKGFEVQLDGKDVETSLGASATSYRFTGLTAGQAHKLGVQATRDGLTSVFATLTLLKPPKRIAEGTKTHNSVAYTWVNDNPAGSATSAEVKIGASGTEETADSLTSHTFESLAANAPHTFYFRLTNAQGPSAWRTMTVTTLPLPKLTVRVTPASTSCQTGSTISIRWSISGGMRPYAAKVGGVASSGTSKTVACQRTITVTATDSSTPQLSGSATVTLTVTNPPIVTPPPRQWRDCLTGTTPGTTVTYRGLSGCGAVLASMLVRNVQVVSDSVCGLARWHNGEWTNYYFLPVDGINIPGSRDFTINAGYTLGLYWCSSSSAAGTAGAEVPADFLEE